MKAVIFFSGLAGLLIFGPPIVRSRAHHPNIAVVVHDHSRAQASWTGQSDCRFEEERSVDSPAASLRELRVVSGSGSLEVVGVEGLTEVQAVARACASHEEFLSDLRLTTEVSGSTLLLETHYPDFSGWRSGNRYARLDLRVEVPVGMAADIRDGSGSIDISNLGNLTIQDGSGEVVVNGIMGDLVIEDGSGELEIQNVSGSVAVEDGSGEITLEGIGSDVEIDDSSGEIQIRGVDGSVTLQDSSGGVEIAEVGGSVRVVADGSGGIVVNGVGGDFVVERDGSGDIRYSGVEGTVDIPRKKKGR